MTNFQAFCRGFASAWDFTRPFSEKTSFCMQSRTLEEIETKYEKRREELGLNKSVWEEVGDYICKAMGEDIKNYERRLQSK